MRFNLGAKVYTSDKQEIGKIDRLVIDPRTNEVQEFVIHSGFFVMHDVIISLGEVQDRVGNDDEHEIHLRMTADQVGRLPAFEQVAYVPVPDGMYSGGFGGAGMIPDMAIGGGATMLWPAANYEPGMMRPASAGSTQPTTNIAAGNTDEMMAESRPDRLFLDTGTDVKAHGETIGPIQELVVDPRTNKVTEIIVRHGLFGGKEYRIPTQFIASLGSGTVHVSLSEEQLARFEQRRG